MQSSLSWRSASDARQLGLANIVDLEMFLRAKKNPPSFHLGDLVAEGRSSKFGIKRLYVSVELQPEADTFC